MIWNEQSVNSKHVPDDFADRIGIVAIEQCVTKETLIWGNRFLVDHRIGLVFRSGLRRFFLRLNLVSKDLKRYGPQAGDASFQIVDTAYA